MSTEETRLGAYMGVDPGPREPATLDPHYGDPYSLADLGRIDPETATDEERAEAEPRIYAVGDVDPTPFRSNGDYCVAPSPDADGWPCTWAPGHTETPHVAGNGWRVLASWPVGEPVRVLDAPGTVEAVRAVAAAVAAPAREGYAAYRLLLDEDGEGRPPSPDEAERMRRLLGRPSPSPASPVAVATDAAMLRRVADALDAAWPETPWNGYRPLLSSRGDEIDDVAAWLRAAVGVGEGPRVLAVLTPEEHAVLSRGVDRELDDARGVVRDAETVGDDAAQGLAQRERDRTQRMAHLLDLPGGPAPAG